MKIVSVDLAYKKPLEIAVFGKGGKLNMLKSVEPRSDIFKTSSAVLDLILPIGKTLVVTETPLILNNMNTAFTLARLQAMIEMGCRNAGCVFFGIHPSTWQAKILQPKKGDDRKVLSIAKAHEYLKKFDMDMELTDDQADAINLGVYSMTNFEKIMQAISGEVKFSEKSK